MTLHRTVKQRKRIFALASDVGQGKAPQGWATGERRTAASAMLLRNLLGRIRLEPVTPDIGRAYLRAVAKLQVLELMAKEATPPIGRLALRSNLGGDSVHGALLEAAREGAERNASAAWPVPTNRTGIPESK